MQGHFGPGKDWDFYSKCCEEPAQERQGGG